MQICIELNQLFDLIKINQRHIELEQLNPYTIDYILINQNAIQNYIKSSFQNFEHLKKDVKFRFRKGFYPVPVIKKEQKSGQQNVPIQQGKGIQHLPSTSVIQKQPQEQQETQIRSFDIDQVLLEEEEEIDYKQSALSLAKEVDKLKQELQQLRVYAETEAQLFDQRDINTERELQTCGI